MSRFLVAVLVVLILAAWPAAAHAQGGLILLADGKTPAVGGMELPKPIQKVWIVIEGSKVCLESDLKVEVPGEKPLRFLQDLFVLEFWPRAAPSRLLLASRVPGGTRANKVFGWVDAEAVLLQAKALKVEDSSIHQKVMIVNTEAWLVAAHKNPPPPLLKFPLRDCQADLDQGRLSAGLRDALNALAGADLQFSKDAQVRKLRNGTEWTVSEEPAPGQPGAGGTTLRFLLTADGENLLVRDSLAHVPIFLAPRADGRRGTNFRLFNVFFVYKVTKDEEFMLIGSASSFSDGTASQIIHGWVPRARLTLWNTREGVVWDQDSSRPDGQRPQANGRETPRRAFRGSIFQSDTAADRWQLLCNGMKPPTAEELADIERGKVLLSEEFDAGNTSLDFPAGRMRYPVLGQEPVAKLNNKRYLVGGYGDVIGRDGFRLSASKSEENRKKIKQLLQDIMTVDIVFVIDDTEQMKPYFPAVEAAVRDVLENAAGLRQDPTFADLKVRVAFTFYAGQKATGPDGKPKAVLTEPLATVFENGTSANAVRQKIDDLCRERLAGKKFREEFDDDGSRLLDGVLKGKSAAKFGAKSLRLLIVVGHGAVPEADDKFKVIVEQMVPEGDGPLTELYGIQVGRANDQRAQVSRFSEQLDRLSKQLSVAARQRGNATVFEPTAVAADARAVRAQIFARYSRLRDELKETKEGLESQHMGVNASLPANARERLQKLIPDLERINEADGIQLYSEGYVWRNGISRDGKPVRQIRAQYKLNREEVKKLHDLLGEIVKVDSNTYQSPKKLQELHLRLLADLIGESADGKTPSDIGTFWKDVHGLRFRSPFLVRKPTEIQGMSDDERGDLLLKYHRLDDILKSQRHTWTLKTRTLESGDVLMEAVGTTPNDEDRWFTFSRDTVQWVWVDGEDELP